MLTVGCEATFTVSVEEAVPFPAMPICPGLKLHVMLEGSPEQARVSCPAKLPVELSATAKFAELPAAMVALAGEMEPLIPPTASWTICVCVISPLAAPTVTSSCLVPASAEWQLSA